MEPPAVTQNPPAADAVVITSNAKPIALECLRHLASSGLEGTVLVDNASEDGTAGAVEAEFPEVEVVRLEPHRGLAFAFNRGVERADAKLLLFLNDDVFAAEGSVSALIDALVAHPDAASAGGRLVDPEDGRTQDRYRPRRFPTFASFAALVTGLERVWPRNPWSGRHLREMLDDASTVTVDQPAGAALLVRREALERVGGWDEGFWFWYEDVDLSKRLAGEGPALYVPSATFRHLGGETVGRWSRPEARARLWHGVLRYAGKHFPPIQRRAFGLLALALAIPQLIAFAFFNRELGRVYRRVARAGAALALGRPIAGLPS